MGPVSGSESDRDIEMSQAPPLPSFGTPHVKTKKRKHGVVESATPSQASAEPRSTKKSKKSNAANEATPTAKDASTKKAAKQTPVVAPPNPTPNGSHASKSALLAASSPAVSARKKTKPSKDVPSNTKPAKSYAAPPKKITPIPPPTIPRASTP